MTKSLFELKRDHFLINVINLARHPREGGTTESGISYQVRKHTDKQTPYSLILHAREWRHSQPLQFTSLQVQKIPHKMPHFSIVVYPIAFQKPYVRNKQSLVVIMIFLIKRRIKATYMARLLYNYNLSIYSKSAYFSDNYSQMEISVMWRAEAFFLMMISTLIFIKWQ